MTEDLVLKNARLEAERMSRDLGAPVAIREVVRVYDVRRPCELTTIFQTGRTLYVEPASWTLARDARTVEVVGLTDADRAQWDGRIA